jgi:hypothetical protein
MADKKTLIIQSLKEVEDLNNEFLKVGELRLYLERTENAEAICALRFGVIANSAVTLKIIGNGSFTNVSGEEIGTNLEFNATDGAVYFTPNVREISISNKYVINKFGSSSPSYPTITTLNPNTIPAVLRLTNNLEDFEFSTSITCFSVNRQSINGNISIIGKFSNLVELYLNNGSVYGDISSLPGKLFFFSSGSLNRGFNYTRNVNRQYILGCTQLTLLSGVDQYLIDMANLAVNPAAQSNHKVISLTGMRSSASDAAVATLQGKGFAVTITPPL